MYPCFEEWEIREEQKAQEKRIKQMEETMKSFQELKEAEILPKLSKITRENRKNILHLIKHILIAYTVYDKNNESRCREVAKLLYSSDSSDKDPLNEIAVDIELRIFEYALGNYSVYNNAENLQARVIYAWNELYAYAKEKNK